MFNKVKKEQGGYKYSGELPERSLARSTSCFGSKDDYFNKPNAEEIETITLMLAE